MAPKEAFWGKPTATMDWCEDNYKVTSYIAEFWNTISNMSFMIPPIIALLIAAVERHEIRYHLCHVGLLSVGIGSWCFHMTLLYSMQLLDELPMLFGMTFLIYSYLEVTSPEYGHNKGSIILLGLYSTGAACLYISKINPVYFLTAYGAMMAFTILLSIKVYLTQKCIKWLFNVSLGFYTGGFILWNIDNNFCGSLQLLRSNVPLILAPVTELHAWWHILGGTGTYLFVVFSSHTRYTYLNKDPKIKFWMGLWPYLTLHDNNSCKKIAVD